MSRATEIIITICACLLLAAVLPSVSFGALDDSYSKVLLHLDTIIGTTVITDESGKSWTSEAPIVAGGKYGAGSIYFDGRHVMYTTDSPDFHFGSGDFTMECWMKTEYMGYGGLIIYQGDSNGSAGTIPFYLSIGSGYINFCPNYVSYPGHTVLQSNVPIYDNTWHHIAVVRHNDDFIMYIDGHFQNFIHLPGWTMPDCGAQPVIIGGQSPGGGWSPMTGYLDEIRISKGIARYLSDFTPGEVSPPPSPPPLYDPDTIALLHFDGNITDESGKVWTDHNGATTTSAVKKFGTGALYLDGINDYLTVANSTDFNFGTSNWTVDWWEYQLSSYVGGAIFNIDITNGLSGMLIGYNYAGHNTVYLSTGSGYDIAANKSIGASDVGVWHHRAVVHSGYFYLTFLDGVMQETWSYSGSIMPSVNPGIGVYNMMQYTNAYIDELRISKVARWIGDFTPGTEAYLPLHPTTLSVPAPSILIGNGRINLGNGKKLKFGVFP